MILKNRFFLLFIFFFIFTSYNFNKEKKILSIFFPIKKIIIENAYAVNSNKLKIELDFLRNSSLFFLQEKKITIVIDKYDFISNIQIRKKYPNTIKIKILENTPVATEINKKKDIT